MNMIKAWFEQPAVMRVMKFLKEKWTTFKDGLKAFFRGPITPQKVAVCVVIVSAISLVLFGDMRMVWLVTKMFGLYITTVTVWTMSVQMQKQAQTA